MITVSLEHYLKELADQHGLTYIEGGLRVKESRNHHVDIMRMIYNWRLVTTPVDCPSIIDRGWCYLGRTSFEVALEEAHKWPDDESDRYVPQRWFKEVHSGRTQPEFFFKL